jgi:hypothetical protein
MQNKRIPESIFGIPVRLGIRASQFGLLAVTVGSAIAGEVIYPAFYIVTGLTLVAQIPLFVASRYFVGSNKRQRYGKKARRITDAQVFALLDRRHPTLTVKRLASATETSEELAEAKLREMTGEGKLESHVPEHRYEVHYTRPAWERLE